MRADEVLKERLEKDKIATAQNSAAGTTSASCGDATLKMLEI
jgi:hypothetical protein